MRHSSVPLYSLVDLCWTSGSKVLIYFPWKYFCTAISRQEKESTCGYPYMPCTYVLGLVPIMKAKIGNMVLYLLFKVILMLWRHRLAGILFLKGLSYLYMTQRAEGKSYSKQTQKSNGRECSLKLTQMFDHKKLVEFHKTSIQQPFKLGFFFLVGDPEKNPSLQNHFSRQVVAD